MISTNQFKNGTHIDVDGVVFKVVEFQHVKPGKGGAFVRTKLKRLSDGAAIDKTGHRLDDTHAECGEPLDGIVRRDRLDRPADMGAHMVEIDRQRIRRPIDEG